MTSFTSADQLHEQDDIPVLKISQEKIGNYLDELLVMSYSLHMATKNITVSFTAADQKLLAKIMKSYGIKVSATHTLREAMQALAEKRGL